MARMSLEPFSPRLLSFPLSFPPLLPPPPSTGARALDPYEWVAVSNVVLLLSINNILSCAHTVCVFLARFPLYLGPCVLEPNPNGRRIGRV